MIILGVQRVGTEIEREQYLPFLDLQAGRSAVCWVTVGGMSHAVATSSRMIVIYAVAF
jgi:hypothetical protein